MQERPPGVSVFETTTPTSVDMSGDVVPSDDECFKIDDAFESLTRFLFLSADLILDLLEVHGLVGVEGLLDSASARDAVTT